MSGEDTTRAASALGGAIVGLRCAQRQPTEAAANGNVGRKHDGVANDGLGLWRFAALGANLQKRLT
jgi:hypothetical protein